MLFCDKHSEPRLRSQLQEFTEKVLQGCTSIIVMSICCVNFSGPTEHWRSKSTHQLWINRQRRNYQWNADYLFLFHFRFWEIWEEKSV